MEEEGLTAGDENDVKAREALERLASNFKSKSVTAKRYQTAGIPNSQNPELEQLVKDDYFIRLPGELKGISQLKQLKADLDRELTIEGQKIPAKILDQYIKDNVPLSEPIRILIAQHNQVPTYSTGNIFRYALQEKTTALKEALSLQFDYDLNFEPSVKTMQHSNYESTNGKVFLTTHYQQIECKFVEQGSDNATTVEIPISVIARFEVSDNGYLIRDVINNTEDATISKMLDECITFDNPERIKKMLYHSIGKDKNVVERNNGRIKFLNAANDLVNDEQFWKEHKTGFQTMPKGVREIKNEINKFFENIKKDRFPNDSLLLNQLITKLREISSNNLKAAGNRFFKPKPSPEANVLFQTLSKMTDTNIAGFTKAVTNVKSLSELRK